MVYAEAFFKCLSEMRTAEEIAKQRGLPVDYLISDTIDPEARAGKPIP